jgi:hypothetical protein
MMHYHILDGVIPQTKQLLSLFSLQSTVATCLGSMILTNLWLTVHVLAVR